MYNKSLVYFIITVLLIAGVAYYDYTLAPKHHILVDNSPPHFQQQADDLLTPMPSSTINDMPIIISDDRITHILYGDSKGGGHRFGAGRPCKSEFPQNWNDERIISVTRKIAANDNLDWKQQDNGYYVAEDFEDDVRVRVVKGAQKQRVITAYPVNMPRNPCPANDN